MEKKKMEEQLRRSSRQRGLPANPSDGATADVIILPASSAVPDGPPEESVGGQPAGSATVASGNENGAAEMESSENMKPKPSHDNSAKERPETKDLEESDVAQGNGELEGRSLPSVQEGDLASCSQDEPQEADIQSPRPGQSSVPAGSLKEMAEKLDDGRNNSLGSKEVLTRVLDGILRLAAHQIDKHELQEADSQSSRPGQSSVPAGSLNEMAEKLDDGSRGPKEVLTRVVRRVLQNMDMNKLHESLQNEEIKYGILVELMELLAKFDPVLGEHMAKANTPSPSYVSPQIVDGLTEMASSQVRKKILEEVKEAKYFAVILDTIIVPPARERKSQVLRYVAFEEGKVVVKEAFVDFIDFEGHASEPSSTQYVLEELEKGGLEIADCRAQASDDLSTIACIYRGVERKILRANEKAIFLPCSNHSMGRAGFYAMPINGTNACVRAQLKSLFAFFAASPHRLDTLRQKTLSALPLFPQWNCYNEDVEFCAKNFDGIIKALTQLEDPDTELPAAREEVQMIKKGLMTFKFLAALDLWGKVLVKVDDVHVYLQKSGLDLEQYQMKMSEYMNFLKRERNALVMNAVAAAKKKREELEAEVEVRPNMKIKSNGEETEDCELEAEVVMRELHKAIDILDADAKLRFEQLSNLAAKFACLHPKKLLNSVEDEKLRNDLDNLALFYRGDVEPGAAIMEEVKVLRVYDEARGNLKNESYSGLLEWILRGKMEEAFPNLMTLLKICLTVCISAATCERNSQKMKLIQRHVHSTVGPERLSALAMLSVEKDAVEKLDFDECLKNLATFTARKIIPEMAFYRCFLSGNVAA